MGAVKVRNRARRPASTDSGAHWISYSDMMASLLLVFVLAICYSVYQYYNMLQIKTNQLNEQQAELSRAQITLTLKEEELEKANVTLMGKQEEVALIQIQLDQKEQDLNAAQAALITQEDALKLLQLKLADQELSLADLQLVLSSQKDELIAQQKRIDNMIGVRTSIIHDLSAALKKANIRATVDDATGDIVLESTVFFETNSFQIKESGQQLLAQFIPVYLSVLLSPAYVDYVGEIIIEGHTDNAGTYAKNLELSMNRARAVAIYCDEMSGLTNAQKQQLRTLLTPKGRSFMDLVYNADGTVNMENSRRVEFKFRMKDEEMITEMNRILSAIE